MIDIRLTDIELSLDYGNIKRARMIIDKMAAITNLSLNQQIRFENLKTHLLAFSDKLKAFEIYQQIEKKEDYKNEILERVSQGLLTPEKAARIIKSL